MSERLTRTSVTVLVPDGRQCCHAASCHANECRRGNTGDSICACNTLIVYHLESSTGHTKRVSNSGIKGSSSTVQLKACAVVRHL